MAETLDQVEEEEPAGGSRETQSEVDDQTDGAEITPELAARREQALRHVRQFGDPILKTKARTIEVFDEALRDEVRRMGLLMDHALGVGLAAPQVGMLRRLLVYRTQQDGPLGVLINPVIDWSSREQESAEEGCLSLHGVHVEVERPVYVRVAAQDAFGDEITVEASGFEARVIQHEMDHLNGVLILDRAARDQRKEAMRTLREWQQRSES